VGVLWVAHDLDDTELPGFLAITPNVSTRLHAVDSLKADRSTVGHILCAALCALPRQQTREAQIALLHNIACVAVWLLCCLTASHTHVLGFRSVA
jgi:hypothetical protein